MNPERRDKESKTSRPSKASTQLERHACFCPPTMHDTKLDQLNKVRMKVKASIAKAKPVPSDKASTFPNPLSGLATIKQPGQATILRTAAHCESKGGSCQQASNQQAAMQQSDTKKYLTPNVSSIFVSISWHRVDILFALD